MLRVPHVERGTMPLLRGNRLLPVLIGYQMNDRMNMSTALPSEAMLDWRQPELMR